MNTRARTHTGIVAKMTSGPCLERTSPSVRVGSEAVHKASVVGRTPTSEWSWMSRWTYTGSAGAAAPQFTPGAFQQRGERPTSTRDHEVEPESRDGVNKNNNKQERGFIS